MSPAEITRRRLELGLTVAELAFALNLHTDELLRIEQGKSSACLTPEFEEAFDIFEERVFGCFMGA
jgi:transcriptional regulator with XRE-family HTH domain